MNSGARDAYQQEGEPHARALIRLAVNKGQVMMPASHIRAWAVQAAFRLMAFVPPGPGRHRSSTS